MSQMSPVILFDGVCNLCHASVAWVIERDSRQIFRFASLQSAAARELLAGREVPDSVVLVDEAGVHFRSTAALRIARRLGFPWSLAAVGLLVPAVLRDAGYKVIARHRYRWFGRQDRCLMPSPELAGRFLDAEETIEVPPAPASAASTPGFLALLLWTYLIVYIFPFPLNSVPDTEQLTAPYDNFWRGVIQWFARHVVGVNASTLPAGSGDTTYNWVETLVDLLLALILTLVWRSWLSPRGEAVRIYVRYFLGGVMLSYGFHKLFPLQMPMPGPDRLISTFADTSPMGLLWTFIGASPAYQMLTGAVEVLGGLLLVFRRTAMAGAFVSTFAMAHVVALNLCYDVPVKLFSSHLLLCALFLLVPMIPRLFSFLVLGLPARPVPAPPLTFESRWARWARWISKTAFLLGFIAMPIYSSYSMMQSLAQEDRDPWRGLYAVESHEGVPPARRWIRAGISVAYPRIGVQTADGQVRRSTYQRKEKSRELILTFGSDKVTYTYSEPAPGLLRLERAGGVVIVLRRLPDAASLLTTRGFHWVNEFPYNR